MSSILVFCSVQENRIKRSSLEVMSRARQLATENRLSLGAAILGSHASSLVSEATAHGASQVFTVSDPVLDAHVNAPVIAALEGILTTVQPRLMVAASTESVKDVLGALAVRTDAAVLPDVASFDLAGDSVVCERPVMAAKKLAATHTTHPLVFVSVRSGSYEASEAPVA
ncbi:MAG: electron transfer flavoprotein subunit alpha/FixB family protein, partial [Rhodothermales bacterium]